MTDSFMPAGYTSVTPYLVVQGAAHAITFYQQAFDAHLLFRLDEPSGRIGHAEIKIGNAIVMLADEHPEMHFLGPKSLGGSPVGMLIYVEDVDASFQKAVAAGAKALRPIVDQFYGDRSGMLEDPFGHQWTMATHREDVTPAEMQRRFSAMMEPKQNEFGNEASH